MIGNANNAKDVLKVVPGFEGDEIIIRRHQNTTDIVREVLSAHKFFASDYDDIVDNLKFYKTISLEEQLFDFCKKNLHYNVESEKDQTTRSPAGIVELGRDDQYGVDCKHYAGYIAGVLDAWNRKAGHTEFDWTYRFASYDDNPAPGHVFVVTRYDDGELWIDPVLNQLDRRFPEPWSHIDKKPETMLRRLSGVPDGVLEASAKPGSIPVKVIGATGAQISKTITSLIPIVANIPVINVIGTYVLEAAAIVASIFGSKYSSSTQVRWLTQGFEWHVKSLPTKSDNNVNAANVPAAQLWFSSVLGVPVYDAITWHNIAGTSSTTNQPLNNSEQDRIDAYKNQFSTYNPAFIAGITDAMILQAVRIAETMNWGSGVLGDWAWMPTAPQVPIDAPVVQTSDGSLAIAGNPPIAGVLGNVIGWARANPLPAAGISALVILGVYELLKELISWPNALQKINARVKVLAKKHPGKKRTTLQKQAGKEYRNGKLGGVKKKRVGTGRKKVGRTPKHRKAHPKKRVVKSRKRRVGAIRSNSDRTDRKQTTITIGSVSSLLTHAKKKLKAEIADKSADLMTATKAKRKREIRKQIREKVSLYKKL